MANTEIRRTSGSTPTNAKKFTVSLWFKLSKIGSANGLFGWRENSNDGNNNLFVRIATGGTFDIYFTSNNGNDTHIALVTNRLFRDCNSWYHAVISVDSTQGTSSNRVKLYINGVQETSFSSSTYPAADRTFFSNDVQINFGKTKSTTGSDTYLEGIESHIHFTDGYAYAASDFGSTDSTTGEWKINTSPSVTYGNNGFWWLKDSIATTDHSPNSNTFSVGNGTLTKTEDCPSNVFATLNPLSSGTDFAFSNGNNTIINSTSTWNSVLGTLAFGTGKYYFEAQRISANGTANIGITLSSKFGGNHSGVDSGRIMYSSNGNVYKDAWSGLSNNTSGGTIGSGDIIGVSIDTENGILKFYRNAELRDTTTNSLLLSSNNEFIPALACYQGGHWRVNFGNGHFADNVVSSAGTNASGNGIFEYDIQPTDATALSTKGLNL